LDFALKPICRFSKAPREKANIETQVPRLKVHLLLAFGQQVQEQGGQTAFLENTRDIPVSAAVPATAAAVSE
jgi:hypothetical protein